MRRAILSLCAAVLGCPGKHGIGAGGAPGEIHRADLLRVPGLRHRTRGLRQHGSRDDVQSRAGRLRGGRHRVAGRRRSRDPPEPPVDPDGFNLVSFQEKETGQGAVVQLFKGSGLVTELWELDADAPGSGPAPTRTTRMHRIGSGTASSSSTTTTFSDRALAAMHSGIVAWSTSRTTRGTASATRSGSTSTAGATPRTTGGARLSDRSIQPSASLS